MGVRGKILLVVGMALIGVLLVWTVYSSSYKAEETIQENDGTLETKRVETFRSLSDAEISFGYYLGLHNSLDSIDNYQLVSIHIVANNKMLAIFDHTEEQKSITIKTSKELSINDLINVYNTDSMTKTNENILGVPVVIGKKGELVNLAYFEVKNGKRYSIYTKEGLSTEDANSLLYELIVNLSTMKDWEE